MYSFLDRLINLALPRTRDFQGVSPSSFDGNGNYSIGVKDQSVFPEIRLVPLYPLSKSKTSSKCMKLLILSFSPVFDLHTDY